MSSGEFFGTSFIGDSIAVNRFSSATSSSLVGNNLPVCSMVVFVKLTSPITTLINIVS